MLHFVVRKTVGPLYYKRDTVWECSFINVRSVFIVSWSENIQTDL